jgi:AraC-like DNA-binding protein
LLKTVPNLMVGNRRFEDIVVTVSRQMLTDLKHLRRAKDFIDREYATPLDISGIAETAFMSPAHFSRNFRAAYGETPYSYLMTRRIERAKAFLRQGMSVSDACVLVGCTSLGSFSSRFRQLVGMTPSQYRDRDHASFESIPTCVSMLVTRPRRPSIPA